MDHEVAHQRCIGIVVIATRRRLPKMSGKIPFQIPSGQKGGQPLTRWQSIGAADAIRQCGRQALQWRSEIPRRIDRTHQALCLLYRVAGETHGLRIECAGSHVFDEIGRSEMVRHAGGANGRVGRTAQQGTANHRSDEVRPRAAANKSAAHSARPAERRCQIKIHKWKGQSANPIKAFATIASNARIAKC